MFFLILTSTYIYELISIRLYQRVDRNVGSKCTCIL